MSVGVGRAAPLYLLAALCITALTVDNRSRAPKAGFHEAGPRTWDNAAMATLEVPLADPIGSPKHVSADYLYKIPVRPIYKQYPVYAPGHEPPGYMDWLKQQEPAVVWDDAGPRPALQTEADWIKAGETVFDSAILYVGEHGGTITLSEVKDDRWYEETGMPVTRDGIVPFVSYVVREKGKVELGAFACALCHTRIMPDGSVLKGAQGNIPFDRALGFTYATELADHPDFALHLEQQLFAVPWVQPDPLKEEQGMTSARLAAIHQPIRRA